MKRIELNRDQQLAPDTCRLIYVSEMTIAGKRPSVARQVSAILEASREFNRRAGITGALLCDLKRFTQVLEGPPHTVKSLYGHIACDSRHKNVTLLEFISVPKREFETWSMAYVVAPPKHVAHYSEQGDGSKSEAELIVDLMRYLLLQRSSN
ncbi:BLUF domain-containing protein (plasmid) [Ensifer adhaerens]|uniref:BLUF domain-containing protein n=1 Tax=Ensifer adhaerens TaxID=106592 RepID=UPI0021015550|nr:BLUF domain-containing protein [Ensifer adhaerens]UTV41808.1 BLUF domain-containing protein [Ensifer adhaerens]